MTTTAERRQKHTKDPLLGKVVAGRYRLEAQIGEGGMGLVYRARHVLIDRIVAIKLIRPDLRAETHLRAWMLREAKAANRVDHAHIIDIYDIGETDEGELYLVMEYLAGSPLSAELSSGPMPITRSIDILEQMCAALARAHDLGVVHRDLKSDNILLTERGGRKDFVKILDFGLAALKRDARLAPKGAVFGTPEYMAPEQTRGDDATPSSDLYALGVLLYEMLTGQLPFRSSDRDALLKMQQSQLPQRPREIRPDANPRAEEIALKLLEKNASDRYRDAHHLQDDLKRLQRTLPSSAAWEEKGNAAPASPPPAPAPQSANVTEWANRASQFTRMVSRAYSGRETPGDVLTSLKASWDLAARASRLEGEVSSLTRKLDALERRGRALRAEIGRKVEELAQEESRTLREASAHGEDERRAESEHSVLGHTANGARLEADSSLTSGRFESGLFERAGAAAATAQCKREELGRYRSRREDKERSASGLRRQIEQLRTQLTRYAEALEEDLTRGRTLVAERAREALNFERDFHHACTTLLAHLRDKPECRDLLPELLADLRMPGDPALNGEDGAPGAVDSQRMHRAPAANRRD
ncbi:MAG: serine/threonine protein kinase [Myxococcales bacterium]|nr:serine/threonine protein kinase [Myxococcales bacterium]